IRSGCRRWAGRGSPRDARALLRDRNRRGGACNGDVCLARAADHDRGAPRSRRDRRPGRGSAATASEGLMAPKRTPDDVRRDIKREREQLGLAVTELRRGVPKVAGAAFAALATLKALKRLVRKRD